MGYIKAIIYGKKLELFTYERNITNTGGKRGGVSSKDLLSDMDKDRELNEQSETIVQQVQKRRDNSKRASVAFRRIVFSNMGFADFPVFITLTYATNQTNVEIGYEDVKSFVRNLRFKFGNSFRYVCVPEFQKRGAIHFHTIFWGLPEDLRRNERSTRLVASLWGRGFVDVKDQDENEKLISYLVKYMSKSYVDSRLCQKRAYTCSRNIFRPVYEKNLGGLMYLEYAYGIGVDNPPCEDREFLTQWLGKGRFRLFNIENNIKIHGNKN